MRIEKILNNNAVIAKDDNNKEVIAIGNGLGFKHSVYDSIYQSEVIKTYALVNKNLNQRLITILNEIPFECIELTEEIIKISQDELKTALNDNLVITLADHINFSIHRYREGIDVPNMINEEIKRFYKKEYEIGLIALRMINNHYNVHLPQDEASSIAFHIINAIEGNETNDAVKIMKGVNDIITIVQNELKIILDENSLDYSRFVIHLKFFMKKILFNNKLENNKIDYSIFNNISNLKINRCLDMISDYTNQQYGYMPTYEDRLYLMMHIVKLLNLELDI